MTTLANTTPAWPSVVDDDGTGQSGTVWNNSFDASCIATLNAQLHSSTNPTIKPNAITDEVVSARGSKATLDARLDVVLNEDGTLKTQDTLASVTDLQAMAGARNLVQNDDLLGWAGGAAAAPDNFTLSGGGAAIARTGSGEADTYSFLAGLYSAKLTYGAATVKLTQEVISTSDFSGYQKVRNKSVAFGMWGKTAVASALSVVCDDGITTTRGGQAGNATYHTGGGTEEWLYGTHTISGTATKLDIYAELAQNTTGYVGGFALMFGAEELTFWPPFSSIGAATASKSGVVSTSAQTFEGVKTFNAPPVYLAGTGLDEAVVSGVLYSDVTARTGTLTAETDASTYTLPANTLSADGKCLRITVWGKTAAGASTRTMKLYWNGSSIATKADVSASGHWSLVTYIMRSGASLQTIISRMMWDTLGLNTATLATNGNCYSGVWDTPAADTTGAIAIKTTLQDSAAGTNITQLGFLIEVLG